MFHQVFGNDEDRYALGTRRIAFDPRQHRVDHVLVVIVVAGGDEYLLAGDLIGAVGLLDRFRLQGADVGTGIRLGQAHGAAPFAGHHLGYICVLLFLGAELVYEHSMAPCERPGYIMRL